MEEREQVLYRLAKRGDKEALQDLLRSLMPDAARFVRRLLPGSGSVEEIVQDASLALYRNLGKVDSAEMVRPYLFRIIRNLCYDELRRRGRFAIVSLDEAGSDWLEKTSDGVLSPAERIEADCEYSELREAIFRLPEAQRQTLILYSYEEFSYAQIAACMRTDIGTVKSRLHYARKQLRKELALLKEEEDE
ncbi:hypothetical protein J31TS4_12390 [Paenibacillus sp. J31TS4]|uniref:RNA polymerase sigma factor n=1 Tax=Paenibacillus sp. J31TS4 TaxID=2807195 RepID=UPI001B2A0B44|nr:sigma-70 family RNA polymerase sigma factor [Paenibacillus sp. J31TS4]GIP37959.1 hypothetical protein J31TS4_12390 [Paenibacillus sp. J31TS4]